MERLSQGRWGLWVFTAGAFAWIFPNLVLDQLTNALTDVVIVVFGILAAIGLPRAVEGVGTGLLRWGLIGVAVAQFTQNLVSAFSLDAGSAAPVIIVMVGSVAVVIGAQRWQEDGWDLAAMPWLAGGFVAFAFEPVYYFLLGLGSGSPFGPYFPGAVLVAVGAVLCAVAFRPTGTDGPGDD